ncbi:hypothetical protein [Aureimonas sp. SK2]|uniref:hypothetical protein n=1 Tax=Aureimonas sp. SK2 TaxID=3015992 RepID=UPI0024450FD0|nr:hypothetical protein [Aureimonas sp. SK2]
MLKFALAAVAALVLAAAPAAAKPVNLPGTIKGGAVLCTTKANVGYDAGPGCIELEYEDDVRVEVLDFGGETTLVRMGGKKLYALSNMVIVTFKGVDMTVYSYVSGKWPPGLKR